MIFLIVTSLSFLIQPLDQIINDHQTATFECLVNETNLITVIWEKDGKQFSPRNVNITTIHTDNGTSSSLTLNRATVSDGGKYRCNATNADGNSVASMEAELISNHPS